MAPVLTGFGVLILWLLDKPELSAFGKAQVPMAPSTALLCCGFGLALFFVVHRPHQRGIQRAAFWIILLGVMAALVLGSLSVLGIRPEVEHLGLVRGPESIGGIPVGHISPLTAVAFILAALAYLSTPTPFPGRLRNGTTALCFTALLLALSLLLLLTYLFGVPLLVGTSFIPPALLTSGSFLALALGLALRTLPHLSLLQNRPKAEVVAGLAYLGVFALVAMGTITLSFVHLRHFEAELRTGAQQQLVAITELKVRQLVEYRKERLTDAFFLMNAPGFAELASRVLGNAADARSKSQFQRWLEQVRLQEQYSVALLVDEQGQVRLSSPVTSPPLGLASLQAVAQALRSGRPQLQDFYLNDQEQHPHLALLVPIHDAQNDQRMRGALVLRLEPRAFLYPFLKAWPLASRTAETLLVRRDGDEVVFLNELRFAEKTALKLRLPLAESELPAARAALGHEGLMEGKDYRGVQVLALLHQIPESPWALVARIDRAEVLAPVRARAWQLLGMNLLVLAAVAIGLGYLWRTQRFRTLQASLQAEAELRESEYRFHHAVEEVPFPMMIHAEDGEVITLSHAWTELSGYSHADIPSIDLWTEKAYGMHREVVIEEINTLYTLEHRKTEGEYSITCHDGSIRIWDFSSVSLGRLPDGRRIAMSMASDVTERKQAEEELKVSEEKLSITLNSIGDAVIATDTLGLITHMNPTAVRLTGWSFADACNRPLTDVFRIVSALTREPSEDPVLKVLAHGEVVGLANHTALLARDGQEFQIADSAAPIRDPNGKIVGVVLVFSDVTERYKVEEALRESEFLLKESQRVAHIGSYRTDFTKDFWTSSAVLDQIFGIDLTYDRSVQGWGNLIYPEDREAMDRYLREEVLGKGRPFDKEYRILRQSDGAVRWVHGLGEVGFNAEGAPLSLTGTIMDVTVRRQAVEALRESNQRMQLATDSAQLAVWDWDLQAGTMIWDDRMFQLYGATREEIHGTVQDWKNGLHPEDLERAITECEAAIKGATPFDTEFRVRHKDGTVLWLKANATVLRDLEGNPVRMVGINRDVTDIHRAEEEKAKLQAQLQQSQKMESLGTLAGGVAHDMNNVLGAILGLASAHIGTQPYGSPLHEALETICKATERGGKMVKSLLSFARQSPVENNKLDMNEILREQVALLERTTLAKVRLQAYLEPNLRPILGDAGALAHAFMNLCVNAVDAMPEHGTLTLHARNVDNDWIEVVVEDNGMGMPKEVLERAMEPFFTTKGTGKGTGLGLSMVFSTVKAHRGQMAIESEPGQGTRVMLRFPACERETPVLAAALAVPEVLQAPHGSLKVLLVDDDDLIQSSVQAILECLGHTAVTTAPSGEAALAMLETGFEPDLVILDMNMPGLGGIGTLPRLRRLRPAVPVLLTTGRVDQTALTLALAHPDVTLLPKPFGLRELQKQLEKIGLG